MSTALSLILLPLRAPMLLLLLLVSTYLGMHWSRPGSLADAGMSGVTDLIWSVECLQALVVVVICTMPDLLLRRLSSIMAASRVASLVITLLLVVTGGLYLLHLEVLSNVLILSSSVMLARLDLVRLRVVPPPFVMTLILCVLVLGGITLGRGLAPRLQTLESGPPQAPAARSHQTPDRPTPTPRSRRTRRAAAPLLPRSSEQSAGDSPATAASSSSAQVTRAGNNEPGRAPDRAIPQAQSSDTPGGMP